MSYFWAPGSGRYTRLSVVMLLRRCYSVVRTPRFVDLVDVCVVGGGPAGLTTAIRFKQMDRDNKYRVVVLDKGSDFGSHIVSGAVLDPRSLRELFPQESEFPNHLFTGVTRDDFKLLLPNDWSVPMPIPPGLLNKNKNYICSLSQFTKWLSEKAEEIGVELYPGVSVSDIIFDNERSGSKKVLGIATKDQGIDKQGEPRDMFERGLQFHARQTVFAEGCRGSLTKKLLKEYDLYAKNLSKQTYGLGIKEVWKVKPNNFKKGFVAHTMGYPLSRDVYGGGFQYHFGTEGDNLVSVGLVVGLDYKNPYVSPYQEFQKMKHHRFYSKILEGGECISYAARALNEGGLQAIPKLNFPGGVLVGASAGFMNVPRIKGTHTAMKSGIIAAEEMFKEISQLEPLEESVHSNFSNDEEEMELNSENIGSLIKNEPIINLETYAQKVAESWIYKELHEVRNIRPSFNTRLGLYGGMVYSGLESMILKGRGPWTFQYGLKETDGTRTGKAKDYKAITYPKPDNILSFDIMTSLSRTGTYHDDNEQCHLRIGENQDLDAHTRKSYGNWQGVEERYCPAGVYEFVKDDRGDVKFKINSQNCIHCKTCDIKDPTEDTNWAVPEGGDGPKYSNT